MPQLPATSTMPHIGRQSGGVYRLWVDGVGAFLVCLSNQVTIGGPTGVGEIRADISLASNLSRQHARLIRSGEVWLLDPLGPVIVNSRPIVKHSLLSDGSLLQLGSSVVLRFCIPTALSGTARLEFLSTHRTQPEVDGVILLAETCVIGSVADAHIRCSQKTESVVLIRRPNGLWCKSADSILIDGVSAGQEVPCDVDRVYAGQNWRFRMEVA